MKIQIWTTILAFILVTFLFACGSGKNIPASDPGMHNLLQATNNHLGESVAHPSDEISEAPTTLDELLELIIADDGQDDGGKKQVSILPDSKNGITTWARSRPGTWQEQVNSLQIYSGSGSIGDSKYMAYAIYKLTGHNGDDVQELDADIGLGPGNKFYVYTVVYSATPHWQRFGPFNTPPAESPEWPIDLPSGVVSGNGNVYIAVVVYSLDVATIHTMEIRGPNGDPEPPSVSVTAPTDGAAFDVGDTTSFTANASDNVGVSKVEFYIKSTLYHTDNTAPYAAPPYTFVEDDVGEVGFTAIAYDAAENDATDTNTVTVTNGGDYDEVENNDSPGQANSFPNFDFSNFTGNLGPGGYDGDDDDWFKFSHSDPVGWTVKLWLHLDSGTGDLDMELEDSNGDELEGSYGIGDEEYIEYTFVAGDTSPFYLHVYAYSGYSDYSVDGQLTEPSEEWQTETVDSTGSVGGYTSLSYDPITDYPAIAYKNLISGNLKYAQWNGSSWDIDVAYTGNMGESLSLAFDQSGNPSISYYTWDSLNIAWWDGSSWDNDTVDSSGGDAGAYNSLAFNSSGCPVISYQGWNSTWSTYALKVAERTGSTWDVEFVDIGDAGYYTSLGFSPSVNRARISYFLEDGSLSFAWQNADGSWNINNEVDATGGISTTSLAFTSSGVPYIAYYRTYDARLKLAWPGGGSYWDPWNHDTPDSDTNVGKYCSLAFDSSGNPCISYYDEGNGNLRFAFKSGGWNRHIVDALGNVGRFTSLAFDSSGRPAISYFDDTNEDLKFAHWLGPWPPAS
ncbi:hypothetical protein J7J84_00860 [bacterium]|nr:hypothetical protein [bacterium]